MIRKRHALRWALCDLVYLGKWLELERESPSDPFCAEQVGRTYGSARRWFECAELDDATDAALDLRTPEEQRARLLGALRSEPVHVSHLVDTVMTAAASGGVNETTLRQAADALRKQAS